MLTIKTDLTGSQAVAGRVDGFRVGFPYDRQSTAGVPAVRAALSYNLSPAAWSTYKAECEANGSDEAETLVGLLQVLLHRYTGAETVEVAVAESQMSLASVAMASSDTLGTTLTAAAEGFRSRRPAATTLEKFEPPRGALFPVVLALPPSTIDPEGGEPALAAELGLSVSVTERGAELRAEYNSSRYSAESVGGILVQFAYLMQTFHRQMGKPLNQVALHGLAEAFAAAQSTTNSAATAVTRCLHHRFEEQVERSPDSIALVMPAHRRTEITYAELNAKANRLARYLQEKGVGPDKLVGLYLDRTADLMVAILAVLKAGGAYLPIDLSYPSERVAFMLNDSEAAVVLAHSSTVRNLPMSRAEVVCLDSDQAAWSELSGDNLSSRTEPDNLAYCIFTSGSTGKPKGVLVTQANVSRLFDATQDWFHFSGADIWTLFHSVAFDFSVWEIWGALLYGGRLVIVPFDDSRMPDRFRDLLAAEQVTVLNQTPSAFRQLTGREEAIGDSRLGSLRLVIFGGEALNLQSLAPWFRKYGDATPQLVNMYGITETTVHVTYRPLKQADLRETPGSVIGIPIPDLQVHLLDAALKPVPVGVPGEIFVGGAGLARGYLKRAQLTAERFIANPLSGGTDRLYRSGDLARRLPTGDLEYLGRIDQQIKIRGFRIELGEIQSALTSDPSLRECFLMARDNGSGDKELIAYVVPAAGARVDKDDLRRKLQARLPGYMVPARIIVVDHLPLTSNGKINVAELPSGDAQPLRSHHADTLPQTALEYKIAGLYKAVLGLSVVGIEDDFFQLGGNSLRVAEMHSQLEALLQRTISVAELFAHTTVRRLAQALSSAERDAGAVSDGQVRALRQRQAMLANRNKRRSSDERRPSTLCS